MSFTPYPNEVYTIFSFFGFIMCIIPLPWHLKAWNIGTCLYMFWVGSGCLIFFINSIVWHGNAFNPAPIWCDICAKIHIGAGIGIPAASLCINRRLYLLQLNPTGNAAITKSEKIRVLVVDLSISLGLPIFIMILHYIPQGHRFIIYENIGCYPHIYNTWVAVVTVNVPQILVGLVSAIYGIRAIISINKRRKDCNELLFRQLNVTPSLYVRIMCLAGIEAILTVPIAGFFVLYDAAVNPLRPWISWEDAHSSFDRVDQFPAIVWNNFPGARVLEFVRWIYVLCAILFFLVFGFAEEARHHYRLAFKSCLRVIGTPANRSAIPTPFQTRPTVMSQADNAGRLAGKGRRQTDSFCAIPAYLGRDHSTNDGDTTLRGSQDTAHGYLESHTAPDSPITWLCRLPLISSLETVPQPVIENPGQPDSTVNTPGATVIERGNERRRSVSSRITQNLRSFLNLDYNDPSLNHASSAYSSQMDISTVEEGQPSKAKHRSRNRLSRPFRSFLNFN